MHAYRSHTCGQLRTENVGETVRLSGWVHRVRDHGGLLFIDLRDHYGLTQIVADPDSPAFASASRARSEWVIRVDGAVVARSPETVNANLPTGGIEVRAREIEILSEAKELPVPVFGEPDYPEETRLTYRFLDLRREKLHRNIMKRGEIIASLRRRMQDQGFFEFQTPILTASSPEGARDYLVPSRVHPGKFYALPQAPQQFKQLTMIAGFDRYFQIAPCFRDEDARADRSPGEFYQLDIEMSFVTQDDVFDAVEPVLRGVFEEFADGRQITELDPNRERIRISLPDGASDDVLRFQRLSYSHALRAYGTDKPDLRNPLEFEEVSDHFRGSDFRIFADPLASNPKVEVWALRAFEAGSRAFCDRINAWAQSQGQPGLAYMSIRDGKGAGPVANRIGPERVKALQNQLKPAEGDAIFFICGVPSIFAPFAALARQKIGHDLELINDNEFAFCWIVDFPMFEWNEDEKKIDFSHNPFSMPQCDAETLDLALKGKIDPLGLLAFQYDIVCNGVELSSGAIRNHKPEIMEKAFAIAGYPGEELENRFGGMLRALQYGAPPHGGIAPGIDRIVMLLCGEDNLRQVVMYPFNQQAQDLLMGAPSEATPKQLKELHIRLALPAKT